jgi:pSer/pThr/pTyr-binding forkhead associated (FHA) protein
VTPRPATSVVVVVVELPTASAPLELTFETDEPISIGRDPSSRVQLPDASVSLRHALLRPSSNGYVVVDENSTNGTFLNSVRLMSGASKLLADGDKLQIGRARLRVGFREAGVGRPGLSTEDIALAMVHGALLQSGAAVAPRVRVVAGPDRGLDLVLADERSYVLGRDSDADLVLTDEDASRRHTRIVRRGSRLWAIDLGSKNGTQLDGRPLRPNVAEAWGEMALLGLGQNQLAIDDPVSSALRNLERVPDEKLVAGWPEGVGVAAGSLGPILGTAPLEKRLRRGSRSISDVRSGFSTVSEPKGVLSLSTSSSSSGPSAPIEVLPFRESEPPRRSEKKRKSASWSVLDALVVGVAVATIALSALALAWFLAS